MRIALTILTVFFLVTIPASAQMAKVEVRCIDADGLPMQGEHIVFVGNGKNIKGITDEGGILQTELRGPGKYHIIAKSIAQNTEGGVLILPTLKPNQSYGTYEVEIRLNPVKEFTLDNVYFEHNNAKLKTESFAELDELFELLNLKKNMIIEIGGHTDDAGTNEYNLDLSKRRAESVKKYLVSKGIDAVITLFQCKYHLHKYSMCKNVFSASETTILPM